MISNEDRIETLPIYQEILKRMISRVDNKYDVSEGSVFLDLLKPPAKEIALSRQDLQESTKLLSVENHTGESLDQWVRERTGQTRRDGTYASGLVLITGKAGTVIEEGTLVASDTATFEVVKGGTVDLNGEARVLVQCLDMGEVGNIKAGYINRFPVTVHGLETVINEDDFTNGYEIESDDSLRERYYQFLGLPATSGNKAHYEVWAKEVVGVGDVKVNPLWNGAGTVQLVIIDSNKNEADEELIKEVYNHVESKRPIGADVTVVSADIKSLVVEADVRLAEGYEIAEVSFEFEERLEEYRKEVAFSETYVSYAKIGSILLETQGVLDYENLRLNGETNNVALGLQEIPVYDEVLLELI